MASTHRLLIADDSVADIALLLSALKRVLPSQFVATEIGDGEEALRLLQSDTQFELVVLDHFLPKWTGLEILTELKNTGKQRFPIVVLTGDMPPGQHIQYKQAGAAAVMIKPVNLDGYLSLAASLGAFLKN